MTSRRYPSTLEGQRTGPDAWRTVSYTSEPVGRALGFAIVFGVLALFLLALAVGLVWLAELHAMWALILFALFGLMGFLLLLPTYFRHTQEGIDLARVAADESVDRARINADYGVQIAQANALILQADNQRRQIELGAERTLSQPAQSDRNRLATFVAPEPEDRGPHWTKPQPLRADPMVQTMLAWAGRVYGDLGPMGVIKTVVPWSERGSLSKQDADRAQAWLRTAAHMQGIDWIVEYQSRRKRWVLNVERYPQPQDLLAALSGTPPPRSDDAL